MKTISTSELRSRTRPLVRSLERGQTVSLTHRGQRLARILPLKLSNGIEANDPLYHFHRLASKRAKSLTDREIDQVVYGP
jgi:antitoxin (DNA-binding transcriptional repressor) of toxin-antitoxin stability system